MEIKVNREIRNYNEAIFLGLSVRQLIFSALAIGVAVGVYFLLRNVMQLETRSRVCILCAAPFGALGFVSYNGMTAEKLLIAVIKYEAPLQSLLCFWNFPDSIAMYGTIRFRFSYRSFGVHGYLRLENC